MEEIYKRASVRTFTDEAVSDAEVEEILRAAMAAPSAGNQQPWVFYVTRDADVKQKLSKASKYAGPAGKASVVIAVCQNMQGLRFPGCAPQDLSACIENALLSIVELGLGAVWLGVAPERERMEKVAEAIACEEGHEPFALIAVGHPAKDPEARGAERFDTSKIIWR